MAKGEHTEDRRGGLFDDLSFSQVAAGALAAVTSMLLASQIGIYGSAIGVGVGSVVSAVASQLYKRFLQRSADKLRELTPVEIAGSKGAGGAASGASAPACSDAADAAGAARVDDALRTGESAVQRARAERAHKRRVKRGVMIVSVASALVAVAVSAVVVDLASSGQGVGAKTEPLLPARSQPAAVDGDSASGQAGQDAPSPSDAQPGPAEGDDAGAQNSGKDAPKDQSGATADSGTDAGKDDGSAEPVGPNAGSGSEANPDAGSGSASGGSSTQPDSGSSGDSSADGGTGDGRGSSSASSQ